MSYFPWEIKSIVELGGQALSPTTTPEERAWAIQEIRRIAAEVETRSERMVERTYITEDGRTLTTRTPAEYEQNPTNPEVE